MRRGESKAKGLGGRTRSVAAKAKIRAASAAGLAKQLATKTQELDEALEQQAATAEVLKVISGSPGDLGPVFQTILANATRICRAGFGLLGLFEEDAFRRVALYNMPPAYIEFVGRDPVIRPPPDGPLGRVARSKQPVHVTDFRDEPVYFRGTEPGAKALVDVGGARSVLGVPMLKEGELVGVIVIFRQEVRPFSERQI